LLVLDYEINWKKNLEPEISKQIEREFKQEMIELDYL
jgi:hypothetical protein